MKCAVQIYMVLGGFHVYKSVFLGWVVGRFNIAVNGEHNCGVPPVSVFFRPPFFNINENTFPNIGRVNCFTNFIAKRFCKYI